MTPIYISRCGDSERYHENFDDICRAIAEVFSEREIEEIPPSPEEPEPSDNRVDIVGAVEGDVKSDHGTPTIPIGIRTRDRKPKPAPQCCHRNMRRARASRFGPPRGCLDHPAGDHRPLSAAGPRRGYRQGCGQQLIRLRHPDSGALADCS